MGWIVNNFRCKACEHEFEELYKKGEETDIICPECESDQIRPLLSSPRLSTYEMADKEGKAAILRKRSADHTKKMVMKDADKFGGHGMQRRSDYKTGKIK